MKRRYWVSIATGAAVFFTTAAELWKYTALPAEDVIFLSLLGYITGTAAAMFMTGMRMEPQARRRRRAHRLGMDGSALWTLERKDWDYGYEKYR